MRSLKILCAVFTLVAAAGLRAAEPSRPNIVFILADDLGINDLACYGRREHHTPHLDRLARDGTRFTAAYCAQPICSPSRAAILTGRTPARLHLTTFLPGRPDAPSQKLLHPKIQQQLPLAETTLAEALKKEGYVTACVGKWHLGGKGFQPADQGFDFVHAGREQTTPNETEGGKGEYDLTRAALNFIETNRARPFFLYLSHHTPHIPYTAKAGLVAKHAAAFEPTYAALIETLDDTVGLLLAKLDELGLRTNTLVIFTSDNGGLHVPELGHQRITDNAPFRAGKGYLYEGGLRVPLIARWPGRIPAGRVTDMPTLNTDWLPTLLELAGAAPLKNLDGESFAGLLTGGAARPRPLNWHFPHYTNQGGRPGGARRDGDWKLVEHYDGDGAELYDLSRDPGETNNLAAREPQRTEEMRQALRAWVQEIGAQTNAPNPNFQAALWKNLYQETDPTRYVPTKATAEEQARIAAWRRQMNAVLPKN